MNKYQSFKDSPGNSRSEEKLERIKLPADLNGKSVLDLGCNEGYFCFEAKQRGASYVLGLDYDEKLLTSAREMALELNLEVEFQLANLHKLSLSRKFDFIIFLSALHYIDQPAQLLSRIRDL